MIGDAELKFIEHFTFENFILIFDWLLKFLAKNHVLDKKAKNMY